MSFLYLNTGYSSIFDESTFIEEQSLLYNTKDKISLKEGYGVINLSSKPKSLCFKLNVVSKVNNLNGLIISVASNTTNKMFAIGFDFDDLFYQCDSSSHYYISYTELISAYGLNTFWFYVVPFKDNTGGTLQCVLNGKILFNVTNSEIDFPNDCFIRVSSSSSNLRLFNFIISEQQFDYSCVIESCPSTIITEMKTNDDGYAVSGSGQMLLHSLNVTNLIASYTKKAPVLGISMANVYSSSSPPYISLNSVEKKNSLYKTTDTFYLDSQSGCVCYSTFLNNLTLNNMKNRVYGWSIQG